MPLANSELKRINTSIKLSETYLNNAKKSFAKKQYERAGEQFKKATTELNYVKHLIET